MAAAITPDMLVVFGVIAVTILLFVTEALPSDTTAIAVIVSLVVLQPWTAVTPAEAISGFANPATLTIVAMYILSGGIERTGVVQRLGKRIASFTGTDRRRILGATVGLTGPLAGVINNTPVVAVFIPMVTDLADRSRQSPSKLLIPLSFASMLGGTLTVIGTATNLLASDISARLLDHPYSMFEFTQLGVVVLVVGIAYLMTVGQWLLPERIRPLDLTERFEMQDYLWRAYVREASPLVDGTIEDALGDGEFDLDVLQIVRGREVFVAPGSDQGIQHRDRLTLRGDQDTVEAFCEAMELRLLPRAEVTEAELDRPDGRGLLVETVIRPDSSLIGDTIAEAGLRERYRATVLAIRRASETIHENLTTTTLQEGDGLLLHATHSTIEHLREEGELVVMQTTGPVEDDVAEPLFDARTALAIAIMLGVIGVAALGWLPIVISALAGVVAMIVTGVINPGEAYDAVHWNVIFLLAGVIPLGIALQKTGGAEFLGGLLVQSATFLPAIAVLGLFYLVTGLLANVITPVASVVLMLPIAVDAASRLGANGFAFALAVTFAASSAFMTPIGYQTNLMVYSPGGYRFIDYLRVGAPLQLLLAVVVTVGIAVFWGLG